MKHIDDYIERHKLNKDVYMLLQVHDELIFEIKTGMHKKVTEDIRDIMESVLTTKETHGVPLTVYAASGKNWGEMKKLS